jgi:hypothetical protein
MRKDIEFSAVTVHFKETNTVEPIVLFTNRYTRVAHREFIGSENFGTVGTVIETCGPKGS